MWGVVFLGGARFSAFSTQKRRFSMEALISLNINHIISKFDHSSKRRFVFGLDPLHTQVGSCLK